MGYQQAKKAYLNTVAGAEGSAASRSTEHDEKRVAKQRAAALAKLAAERLAKRKEKRNKEARGAGGCADKKRTGLASRGRPLGCGSLKPYCRHSRWGPRVRAACPKSCGLVGGGAATAIVATAIVATAIVAAVPSVRTRRRR